MLDISRLLSRSGQGVPTGIDRVELAYAEYLFAERPGQLRFACLNRLGRIVAVADAAARRLVGLTRAAWQAVPGAAGRLRRFGRWLDATLLAAGRPSGDVYLLVSHHHLNRPAAIAALLAGGAMRFVCLVHDLIPIEFPEYARPGEAAKHRLRMQTVAQLADGIIANSAATAAAMRRVLDEAGRHPPMIFSGLGIDAPPIAPPPVPDPGGLFVCLGTIEPRKNHLLLLNVWRRMAEAEKTPPRLVLVGRRGWENENIVDMLDRCDALRGLVEEVGDLPDLAVSATLRRASALLMPSFAEGYGLPIAEALALGVPVLCSFLPALREVGGEVPDYLDPLDGPGWLAAIRDYAEPDSPRRRAQIARLARWRAPTWHDHMAAVLTLFDAADESQKNA